VAYGAPTGHTYSVVRCPPTSRPDPTFYPLPDDGDAAGLRRSLSCAGTSSRLEPTPHPLAVRTPTSGSTRRATPRFKALYRVWKKEVPAGLGPGHARVFAIRLGQTRYIRGSDALFAITGFWPRPRRR
jgi:hypothetical protein